MLNTYGVPVGNQMQAPKPKGRTLQDRIRVCVRKRPMNKKEVKRSESDIAIVTSRRSICIHEPK
jgi:kinesin family protein 2/24